MMGLMSAALGQSQLTIRWFGQSFFQVTDPEGTRIVIDPFGEIGFPLPDVSGEIVTVSHEHRDHNNVGLVKGHPRVLRGLTTGGADWNKVDTTIGKIRIYNLATYHDNEGGAKRGKNSIFVYELAGLRLAHLGDLGHTLTLQQLARLGQIDILILPVGGNFTIDAQEATQVVEQVKPRVIIPMHFKTRARPDWPGADESPFLAGKKNVRRLASSSYVISKDKLPDQTEIVVLQY